MGLAFPLLNVSLCGQKHQNCGDGIRPLNKLAGYNTVNQEIFVLKYFHAIIFRVKIFSYASRLYENILTTKMFLQREFSVRIIVCCNLIG